jgi:RNase adapter protein RapZ
MSGAGKSHALRALEDLGYYCVDNLPTPLIPVMADLTAHDDSDARKIAVVADVRERSFISEFPPMWKRLKASRHFEPVLVFLDASDAALLRRFSETRRPHPLAPDRPVADALQEERAMLGPIRRMADSIVDTSDLTVHELRQFFQSMGRGRTPQQRLVLTFQSFGFKNGVPLDADLVFDCRFLPNPHFVAGLRAKTGRDKPVISYMQKYPETKEFRQRVESFLRYVVPHFVEEGKAYLTVAIGCTGGKHRSVFLAETLKRELGDLPHVTTRESWQGERLEMIGVVVVTHGQLATELVNAAEAIVGDLPTFTAVSIGWHEDVQDARDDIAAAIARVQGPDGVLIATDMFGGTPSNLGITFLELDKVEVVTGVNLPMLIKAANLREQQDLTAVARSLREHGRNAIWVASDLLKGSSV